MFLFFVVQGIYAHLGLQWQVLLFLSISFSVSLVLIFSAYLGREDSREEIIHDNVKVKVQTCPPWFMLKRVCEFLGPSRAAGV